MGNSVDFRVGQDVYCLSPRVKNSFFRSLGNWTEKGDGIYKSLGLIQKTFEAMVNFASNFNFSSDQLETFSKVADDLHISRKYTIIQKITCYTGQKFVTSFQDWFWGKTSKPESSSDLVYDTIDLAKDFTTFSKLFTLSSYVTKLIAKGSNALGLIYYPWNIKRAYNQIQKCNEIEKNAYLQKGSIVHLKNYLNRERKYQWMQIAVAVMDLSMPIIFFAGLITGAAVVSALTLWTLGTASLVLMSYSDFYTRMRDFDLTKKSIEHIKSK